MRAASRTGSWSLSTTSRPSCSTRRRRPTSRPRGGPPAGGLAEARTYLTYALAQLTGRARPGPRPPRDRRCGCERGFLTAAAEGYQSREAAADFERCLQLGGTDLRDDELVRDVDRLGVLLHARADLRRAAQVIESLRAGLGRVGSGSARCSSAQFGLVAWLRGEFDAARSHLELATAGWPQLITHEIDAVWFSPTTRSRRRTSTSPLSASCAAISPAPRPSWRTRHVGPNSSASPRARSASPYARFVEIWVRIEAGQFDRAAALAADLTDLAERHGFDLWRLAGPPSRPRGRLAALGADHLDPTGLSAHIATMTTFVDTLRTVGREHLPHLLRLPSSGGC